MSEQIKPIECLSSIVDQYLPSNDLKLYNDLVYGCDIGPLDISATVQQLLNNHAFDFVSCKFPCPVEQVRKSRIIRVGLFQHQTPQLTSAPINEMRSSIFQLAQNALEAASACDVNIFCFQEAWNMPFAFCTREKSPWCEYAENAQDGPTSTFLKPLARKYNMVIVSPILERDPVFDTIWNTAVVIDNEGKYLGKHRKNHIPRVGDFNESTYYMEGNTGHPVFETIYGRIAINICYGRHHPLNWLMFALNGAEIVFNPSATIAGLSETLWGLEARTAAVANGYYTCAINRVGTEIFPNNFTSGDGKAAHNAFGHFYGSSYITAPNGTRSKSLSRTRNGLLVAELDLNLCRQVKDHWGFQIRAFHS